MDGITIWAISDLHLPGAKGKSMAPFGPVWDNHVARIEDRWRGHIRDDDLILIPGDISWALRLPDAMVDIDWLARLPGRKIIGKGNHDYWWPSPAKMKSILPESIKAIYNDAVLIDGVAVGGSRLWNFVGMNWPTEHFEPPAEIAERMAERRVREASVDDEKIRNHEIERLRLSLSKMPREASLRVAMLHFPPFGSDGGSGEITRMLDEFNVDVCVFGHIHRLRPETRPPGADIRVNDVRYALVSCDWLEMVPKKIWSSAEGFLI